MKKTIAIILTFVTLLTILCGCRRKPIFDNEENGSVLTTFAEFMDDAGFKQGITPYEFINDILPKYQYDGKPLTEIAEVSYKKAINEFSWLYEELRTDDEGAKRWERCIIYTYSQDGTYHNNITTRTSINGLDLPFNITVYDNLYEILDKLGLSVDPDEYFTDKTDSITLLKKDGMSLTLSYYNDESIDYAYEYCLIFTDKSTVTRSISFNFGWSYYKLDSIRMDISDKTPALTKDILKELAQKGENLTWGDLIGFKHENDEDSELNTFIYDIDDTYELTVTGEEILPEANPISAYLRNRKTERKIDIMKESPNDFLMQTDK